MIPKLKKFLFAFLLMVNFFPLIAQNGSYIQGLAEQPTYNRVLVQNTEGTLAYRNLTNIFASNGNWSLTGNPNTNPTTNFLGTTDLQPLNFRTNNTQQMTILSNGNVGIGTTTPMSTLQVAKPNSTASLTIGSGVETGGQTQLTLRTSQYANGFTEIVSVKASGSAWGDLILNGYGGNVGIGTTTPQAKLHVNNGDNSYGTILANSIELPFSLYAKTLTTQPSNCESFRLGLKYNSVEQNGFISFYRGDGDAGGFLGFSTNGVERIRIATDGNVGIGTTTPQAKLDVSGIFSYYGNGLSGTTLQRTSFYSDVTNGNLLEFALDPSNSKMPIHFSWRGDGIVKTAMTILPNGNVGIGTTSPTQAKLVVTSGGSYGGSYRYYNNSSGAGYTGYTGSGGSHAILATGIIGTTSEFRAYSDARIKESKGEINTSDNLKAVQGLKIQKYAYKDKVANGNEIKTGVFAQDVEKVFPEAVQQITEFIPNVYQMIKVENNYLTLNPSFDIKENDIIKYYDISGDIEKEETAKVISVTDKGVQLDKPIEGKEVFVYGKQVNDFRNVDYDRLTILGLSAIQELIKKQEQDKAIIEAQASELQEKTQELATQSKELSELKAGLNKQQSEISELKKLLTEVLQNTTK